MSEMMQKENIMGTKKMSTLLLFTGIPLIEMNRLFQP